MVLLEFNESWKSATKDLFGSFQDRAETQEDDTQRSHCILAMEISDHARLDLAKSDKLLRRAPLTALFGHIYSMYGSLSARVNRTPAPSAVALIVWKMPEQPE